MQRIPRTILARLERRFVEQRSPAWFEVDARGRVTRCGGERRRYGFDDVAPGDVATEVLPCLVGVMPLVDEAFDVRALDVGDGRHADVHCLPGPDQAVIVFLDCTEAARRERGVRQCRSEIARLKGGLSDSP